MKGSDRERKRSQEKEKERKRRMSYKVIHCHALKDCSGIEKKKLDKYHKV